jgi:hypothetical protein
VPRRRQASEQNFTSSQQRAQRLRQVMVRPQAAQGLLGRAALLPRKRGRVLGRGVGMTRDRRWKAIQAAGESKDESGFVRIYVVNQCSFEDRI